MTNSGITREELKKVLSDFGMYLSSVKPGVMDRMLSDLCNEMI